MNEKARHTSIWKVALKIVFLICFKIQFTWFLFVSLLEREALSVDGNWRKNECGPKKMSVDKKKWVCWVWVWVWSVECGVLSMTVPYLGNPRVLPWSVSSENSTIEWKWNKDGKGMILVLFWTSSDIYMQLAVLDADGYAQICCLCRLMWNWMGNPFSMA